jgi:hypothetical protein
MARYGADMMVAAGFTRNSLSMRTIGLDQHRVRAAIDRRNGGVGIRLEGERLARSGNARWSGTKVTSPASNSAIDASYFRSQMIARAIGKPRTKAPAIAIVNSVSKFGSARNLLTDIFHSTEAKTVDRTTR